MVKSGEWKKKERQYRKGKEERKSREKIVIEKLISGGMTTGDITASMGYDKRDYHNIANILPKMVEEGKIKSRKLKRKKKPGPPATYWEIETLDNIKNSIGGDDHLISLAQRSNNMLDIIADEYKRFLPMESLRERLLPEFGWIANAGFNHFKNELLEYLSFSPTFFKMLIENDPEETSKIIERRSDPFGLQEGEDLLCKICPWKSRKNIWCYAEGGDSCQIKEGLERNKRIFAILTFYRYCLAADAIENPKDESFTKKLEEAEKKIYWYRSFLGINYVYHCLIEGIKIIKKDKELMEKQRERLKEIMGIIEGLEKVDSRVLKESIEIIEKGETEREEEYKVAIKKKRDIPIEKVKELLPELKIDEEYCSKEEYEYIPNEEVDENERGRPP